MAGKLANLTKWLIASQNENFESLLICNNCTDETFDELQLMKSKNSLLKTRIILTGEKGPGVARNLGLDEASGDYVVFWDADDVGDIEVLSRITRQVSFETDLIISNYKLVSHDEFETLKILTGKDSCKLFQVGINPGVWRMVFDRKFILGCRFGTSMMGEDQVFLGEVLARGPRIVFDERCVYSYFKGIPGQLTGTNKNIDAAEASAYSISKLLTFSSTSNKETLSVMTIRLIITLLIKGSLKAKFNALKLIKNVLINQRSSVRVNLLPALRLIFRVVKETVIEK
jgi:glycosyltransferase involved in cell wall biosynthesis